MSRFVIITVAVSCYLLISIDRASTDGCNEYVCGSVVSKCLLTQSCQCKLSDCYCCKDCLHCLGDLYTECCGCLDMCPKHNETLSALSPKSQIGDFEGVPELFETLTAEDDDDQWTIIRFPMRASFKRRFDSSSGISNNPLADAIDRHASMQKSPKSSVNCTVIYLNACTTNRKCSQYCESMGSSSYRWFHDGCCECVGSNCFNYGINESRCSACPEEDDENSGPSSDNDEYDGGGGGGGGGAAEEEEEDESLWDYGEEEANYN